MKKKTIKVDKTKEPRILLYDIETSLAIATIFQLKNDYISHQSLLQDWNVISVCWKWLGEDKVYSSSVLKGKNNRDDKKVIEDITRAMEKADIIIAHNGDKFDIKKLNTRRLYHGMKPLVKPAFSIDTLKVAKKEFGFTSNRLDYIAQFLGVGKKLDTSSGLWMKVLKGERKAVKEMLAYNKVDVLVLEKVYQKLRPFMSNHPNMNAVMNENEKNLLCCKNCGSKKLRSHGWRYTNTGKYRRYRCDVCGAVTHSATKEKGYRGR